MTLTDYFYEIICNEAISFSKVFALIVVLFVVFRLVSMILWRGK